MENKNLYFIKNAQGEIVPSNIAECDYAVIQDIESFKQECHERGVIDYPVNDIGYYEWSAKYNQWETCPSNTVKRIFKVVTKITKETEEKEKEDFLNPTRPFVGWNIIITLNTNEVIKTNSEPVSMAEVQEAMNTMLKPSFFGKRITKFEIVAE